MLSFSGGCAINLDDLGDFPDYQEVVAKLIKQIDDNNVGFKDLKDFLEADLQDVQHLPQFDQLVRKMLTNYKLIFGDQEKSKLLNKFVIFALKMVKNYFTSFSVEEQQAVPLINFLTNQLPNHQNYFSDFLLAISVFSAFAQKHEEIVKFYLKIVNEQIIFEDEKLTLNYIKSVDKILRFRQFRQAFLKLTPEQFPPFLNFKVFQYSHNKQKIIEAFNLFKKSLPKTTSPFCLSYVSEWQNKLK